MTFRLPAAVAVACLLCPAAPLGAQRLDPVERYTLLRSADSAYQARRYGAAAELYRRIMADYPEDGDLWLRMVFASFYSGDTTGRMTAAASAIEKGSYFFRERLAHEIARSYGMAGNRAEAFRWLRRALEMRYTPRTSLATDTAFRSWRADPEFRELAGMLPERPVSRDEGRHHDLRFLASEAKRLHTSFKRQAFSPAFDAMVEEIDARIPTLTDRQFLVELQKLVVLLEDGHSKVISPPTALQLPVDLYFFSDGLFIVGGVGEGAGLVGAKIVRFGSRSTEEIAAESKKYIHRDNEMGLKWIGAWTLTMLDYLHAMGGSDDSDRVTLQVVTRSGETKTVTLAGVPMRYRDPLKLGPPPGSTNPARYLSRVRDPYLFERLPDANAVYLQFNQVRETEEEPLRRFVTRMSETLRDPSIRNLIVDVRHNTGGNSFLFPPLLRAIAGFQEWGPGRRIFYLTGRHTFSAAQNFSTNIERITDAVFVGEPTGSSPNFVGEGPNIFTLPYSGIQATISSWYHQFSFWNDTRQWIAPDIPVPLSSTDYFANRDPALDAVLEIIRRRP